MAFPRMYIAVADYGIAMIAQLVNEVSNHFKNICKISYGCLTPVVRNSNK